MVLELESKFHCVPVKVEPMEEMAAMEDPNQTARQ